MKDCDRGVAICSAPGPGRHKRRRLKLTGLKRAVRCGHRHPQKPRLGSVSRVDTRLSAYGGGVAAKSTSVLLTPQQARYPSFKQNISHGKP